MSGRDVVILSGVRTPIGSFLGSLKDVRAQTMGARVIEEALRRAGVEASQIDEVVMGNNGGTDCRSNIAREAMLETNFPVEIPAFTVGKACASGLKSIALAASIIRSGEADVMVAGGLESMSRAPYILQGARGGFRLRHVELTDSLLFVLEGMGLTAERLAEEYSISRQEQDQFACQSQFKAAQAQQAGLFDEQILPIAIPQKKGEPVVFKQDEGVRPNTTMEVLAKLRPAFKEGGTVTAGNSSTINDGAAAVVLASAEKARALGLKPLAKVKAWAAAGCDPAIMGIGPVPATRRLLKQTGMGLDDFDLVELNEAFAVQVLAVCQELPFKSERLNVNGGAIALGHPVGASGSILIVKLIHEMKRRQAGNGLVTICIGGGQGLSLALENMS
jgi:acetyl-CoA C-acetyltransferase